MCGRCNGLRSDFLASEPSEQDSQTRSEAMPCWSNFSLVSLSSSAARPWLKAVWGSTAFQPMSRSDGLSPFWPACSMCFHVQKSPVKPLCGLVLDFFCGHAAEFAWLLPGLVIGSCCRRLSQGHVAPSSPNFIMQTILWFLQRLPCSVVKHLATRPAELLLSKP